jgi:MtN3 and saliva related transmembrane protein
MTFISIIGFVAASLTTIATVPQVIKVVKTKKTTDLSLLMYIIMTLGVLLWLIYGLFITDYPLIIANFITFGLVSTILIYKLKYK